MDYQVLVRFPKKWAGGQPAAWQDDTSHTDMSVPRASALFLLVGIPLCLDVSVNRVSISGLSLRLGSRTAKTAHTSTLPGKPRVPAVYLTSAFLAVLAVVAFCRISKLRGINTTRGFDSRGAVPSTAMTCAEKGMPRKTGVSLFQVGRHNLHTCQDWPASFAQTDCQRTLHLDIWPSNMPPACQ